MPEAFKPCPFCGSTVQAWVWSAHKAVLAQWQRIPVTELRSPVTGLRHHCADGQREATTKGIENIDDTATLEVKTMQNCGILVSSAGVGVGAPGASSPQSHHE